MTAMNRSTELIDTARNIVAITLRASGREDLAKMMLQGAGDDLPELSATVAALTDLYGQHARLKVSESWGPRIMRLDGSIYYRLSSSTA